MTASKPVFERREMRARKRDEAQLNLFGSMADSFVDDVAAKIR